MSIFLSSGEVSGDHYTAAVTKALRKIGYKGDLWGMGGNEAREAGIRAEWPGEDLQLFGIAEVLSSVPSLFRLLNEMTDRIMEEKPQSVVIADSPDFNIRLAHKLKSKGFKGKVFYISPPTVWAWRSGRVKKIAACVDECFPLFKFEHEFFIKKGCNSYWTGHPMTEELSDRESLAKNLPEDLRKNNKIIAFLPGSRGSEIRNLLPLMEDLAGDLQRSGWNPVFSIAPGLNEREKSKMSDRLSELSFDIYRGEGRNLLAASACSIAASGTVAVEAMMLGRYMVVAYKVSPISAFIGRRLVKTTFFTIPNILLGEELYPEFMQERATRENILKAAEKWLYGDEMTKNCISKKMAIAKSMLGETGVYESWAQRIMGAD